MKNNYTHNKSKPSVELYDVFTKGKSTNFILYYNVAYDQIVKYIEKIEAKPFISNIYDFQLSNDKNYLLLKEYIWKGVSTFQKNDDYETLNVADKQLIKDFVIKLNELRNFNSHFWHDNGGLQFENNLYYFIENAYEIAIQETSRLEKVDSRLFVENKKNFPLFKRANGKNFITQEGRLFFLSFFLHKGDMNALMQITTGNKANSDPEHRFKRKAYTYYCHREGASLLGTQADETTNELLPQEEQERNYKGALSSKLLNYLKDKPLYYNNPEFMPLWIEQDSKAVEIQSIKQLLAFIHQQQLFPFLSFEENDLSESFYKMEAIIDDKEREKMRKYLEDKERIGSLSMYWQGTKEYVFEIAYPVLYQIVSECYLHPEKTAVLEKSIESLVQRRTYLYQLLKDAPALDPQDAKAYFESKERQYFYPRISPKEKTIQEATALGKSEDEIESIVATLKNDYYNIEDLSSFPIGATPKTIEKLKFWENKVIKGKEEINHRKRALNLFRPKSQKFINDKGVYKTLPNDTAPEPILYHLAEFYKGENEKPRTEDYFLKWAGQYLSDFDRCTQWEFAYEDYRTSKKIGANKNEETTGIKKAVHFANKIPKGKSLKLMQQQLFFRVAKHPQAQSGKDYHYFMLGKKAMVYILYWDLINSQQANGKSLNELTQLLGQDLDAVAMNGEAAIDMLKLYEYRTKDAQNMVAGTLPTFKIKSEPKPTFNQAAIVAKIDYKIASLQAHLAKASQYNRNELNAILLQTYKYFDFSETVGKKYLRKNEYQLMSVVHYMLNQKIRNPKKYLDKQFEVNGTYLGRRLPYIIYNTIIQATSLKDLFITIIENRIKYFYNMIKDLEKNTPSKIIKKLYPHYQQLFGNVDSTESNKGKETSYPYMPMYIDPNLILKYYDTNGFAQGDYHPDKNDSQKKYKNIYQLLRVNNANKQLLINHYYADTWITTVTRPLAHTLPKMNASDSARWKKLHNWYNKYRLHTHSEDILLCQIALQYMEGYNKDLYQSLMQKDANQYVDVKTIFSEPIMRRLGNKGNLTNIYYKYYLHQTDDNFYRTHQQEFYALAQHYLARRNWEIAYYKDHAAADRYRALPDGSNNKEQAIDLGLLLQEKKIIATHGLEVLQHIADLEASYVYDLHKGKDKQAKALVYYQQHPKGGKYKYISLSDLLQTHEEPLASDISKIRNEILHTSIPSRPYVQAFDIRDANKEAICTALRITARIGKDQTLENKYLIEKEK